MHGIMYDSPSINILMSLVNKIGNNISDTYDISFIYDINESCPRTEPYGMPQLIY